MLWNQHQQTNMCNKKKVTFSTIWRQHKYNPLSRQSDRLFDVCRWTSSWKISFFAKGVLQKYTINIWGFRAIEFCRQTEPHKLGWEQRHCKETVLKFQMANSQTQPRKHMFIATTTDGKQRLQTTAKLHWRARNKPTKTRPEPAFGWALIGWVVGRLLNHGRTWETRACDFFHVVDPGECREFLFCQAAWVQDKRLKRRVAQIACQHDNGACASASWQLHPLSGRDFAYGSLQILLSPPNLGQSLLVIAAAKSTVLWPTFFLGLLCPLKDRFQQISTSFVIGLIASAAKQNLWTILHVRSRRCNGKTHAMETLTYQWRVPKQTRFCTSRHVETIASTIHGKNALGLHDCKRLKETSVSRFATPKIRFYVCHCCVQAVHSSKLRLLLRVPFLDDLACLKLKTKKPKEEWQHSTQTNLLPCG